MTVPDDPTKTIKRPSEVTGEEEILAGKFRIIETLGRGGMGVVYKAEDTKLDRTVALKFLSAELLLDSEARERFVTEAQAASRLDHPNICTIHEIGETEDGLMYIAMPYYKGQTLKEKMRSGDLGLEEGLDIIRQIAQGLAKAQGKGIVHRDIKPANVIVTEDGLAKVLDFGLAKLAGVSHLTKTGTTMGTVGYMSPEQAQGEEVDSRTDIWSLGVLLYEILTGQLPFKGESEQSVIYSLVNKEPERISKLVDGLPEELEALVSKTLQKDQGERYQSFDEFLIDLKEVYKRLDMKQEWRVPRRVLTEKKRWIASPFLWAPALVLIAAVVGLILFYPTQAISFKERDWILLTDFENQTGDEVFDRSLDTALTVGLQQSRYANVYPRSRVKETFQRMQQDMPETLDVEAASEVAQREGFKAVVACRISSIGDTYVLSAELIDPNTRAAVKTVSTEALGMDEVLPALDELTGLIRRDLGESLSEINDQRVELERATTSSLAALKKFSEGQWFWNNGKYDEAAQLQREAVALDPDFAWAHANLGGYYYWWGNDRAKGEEHFEKTLALLDRLTERERMVITAWIEAWRGNREEAARHYRILVSAYPDSRTYWFNLGNQYMRLQRFDEALEAYGEVLRIDPLHANAYVNIATCYGNSQNAERAIEYYEKAFELKPEEKTNFNINHEFGFNYVKIGEYQKAREVFETMLTKDSARQATGHRSLAVLNMYLGKYAAAEGHIREAVLIQKARKQVTSELRDRLYLAAMYRARGMDTEFRKELDDVLPLCRDRSVAPYWSHFAAKLYIRQGWLDEGEALAGEIVRRLNDQVKGDRMVGNILAGELALTREEFAEAIELLGLAQQEQGGSHTLESLAYAHMRHEDWDEAIPKYEELIELKELGFEVQEHWLEAHLHLGRMYEAKGETDKAIQYYQKLVDLWAEADEDLPLLLDAKQRLN
jgi:serine/threonine protein kinase/tetratricopeptide (TPR) repeat protein